MKQIFAIFALIVLLSACAPQTPMTKECSPELRSTPHYFVVSATDNEFIAVYESVELKDSCQFDGTTYYFGSAEGVDFIFFETGVGKELSVGAVETTFNEFNVIVLVFSGTAGRLAPDLSIGDVIIVTKWQERDTQNFSAINEAMISTTLKVKSDSFKIVISELGITSSEFVSNGSQLFEETGATIVDMESYYLSELAHNYNKPFIAIRAISDYADGIKGRNKDHIAQKNSAQITFLFLSQYSK